MMSKKGKKRTDVGKIGRSLIKDRNKSNRRGKDDGTGWVGYSLSAAWWPGLAVWHLQLHSSDLEDGYDWGRLNLHSVTEQSRLEEFLSTAELAGVEFKAEKLNIKVVEVGTYTGLPTEQERAETRKAEEENVQYLSIPRR
jgi:large subunit GTPase 1